MRSFLCSLISYLLLPGDSSMEIPDSVARFSNKSLIIVSLKSEYAGKYTCEADNGVGKPIKKTIKVHVYGEERFFNCI